MYNANTAPCFTGNCFCMSSGKTPGHFQTRFARRFLSGFPWHAQSSYPDIAGALRTPHSICTPFVFPMEQTRSIPACFARHVVSFDLDIICMFSTNTQSSPAHRRTWRSILYTMLCIWNDKTRIPPARTMRRILFGWLCIFNTIGEGVLTGARTPALCTSDGMCWDPIHSGGPPAQPATPRRKQESGGGMVSGGEVGL